MADWISSGVLSSSKALILSRSYTLVSTGVFFTETEELLAETVMLTLLPPWMKENLVAVLS